MWNYIYYLLRRSWIFFSFFFFQRNSKIILSPLPNFHLSSQHSKIITITIIRNKTKSHNLSFLERVSTIFPPLSNSSLEKRLFPFFLSRSTFPFFFFIFFFLQLVSTLLTSSLKSISVFTRSRRDRITREHRPRPIARVWKDKDDFVGRWWDRDASSFLRLLLLLLLLFLFLPPSPLFFIVRSTIRRVEESGRANKRRRNGEGKSACRMSRALKRKRMGGGKKDISRVIAFRSRFEQPRAADFFDSLEIIEPVRSIESPLWRMGRGSLVGHVVARKSR